MVNLSKLMENEVFMAFASYTTIVLSKMMFMSIATAFYRLTRKVRHGRQYFNSWDSGKQFSNFFCVCVKPNGILFYTVNEYAVIWFRWF